MNFKKERREFHYNQAPLLIILSHFRGPEFAPGGSLPYPVPGGLNQLQGGQSLLPYPFQGGLSSCLEPLGTLVPYFGQGNSSLPQGDQGLLPYLV